MNKRGILGRLRKMIYRYRKQVLEQFLANMSMANFSAECHSWRKFELYNGKPEPEIYKVSTFRMEEARQTLLERVRGLNGHLSRIRLCADYSTLDIRIGKANNVPAIKIEYEGAVYSYSFKQMLEKEEQLMSEYKL
jgi:hypothetical protein